MGVVYSVEDVRSSRVPEPGAHETAARDLLTLAQGVVGVKSALIYGSVPVGNATRRSDVDALFVVDDVDAINRLREEAITIVYQSSRVKIEPHIEIAGSESYSDRDASFIQYLIEASKKHGEEWGFGDPGEFLEQIKVPSGSGASDQALIYVGNKLQSLTRGFLSTDPDRHKLQRALELSSTIGRKAIPLLAISDMPKTTVDSSGRQDISWLTHEALKRLSGFGIDDKVSQLHDLHKDLLDTDARYSEVLEDVLGGRVSIDYYEQWINDNYHPTLLKALNLAHRWLHVLDLVKR